ncbi:SRPBCC domain-containing protein [Corallococcus sp. CA049B]|uniref:SRPBCC domain-containing protein n=1 Tax=Corallococcus sp. CA049B TaxID=2316730 RepID=UPI002101CDA2|nr:SRPBCC domain-containing protein [Corallococcus sp. CA049B]
MFKKWWVPKSMGMTLASCEMDVRTRGTYRLVFGEGMAFFGRYTEVTPHSRLVWTNEEGGDDASVTTVTDEEKEGKTLLVVSELYPSKEALDAAGGAADALVETFQQPGSPARRSVCAPSLWRARLGAISPSNGRCRAQGV